MEGIYYNCTAVCSELEGEPKCRMTNKQMKEREEKVGDVCPCGNIPKWVEEKDGLITSPTIGMCKECGQSITELDAMKPDYPNLYECSKCYHPHTLGEL